MLLEIEDIKAVLRGSVSEYASNFFEEIVHVHDDYYEPLSGPRALELLGNDPDLSPAHYQSEVFDCDDFTYMARAKAALLAKRENLAHPYCLGILIATRHATNFTIDEDSKVHLVDFYYRQTSSTNFQEFLISQEHMGETWLESDSLRLALL